MNSKVRVTADAAGNVIVPSKNNSEWGHIRVEQTRMIIDDRGFARKKTVSALIPGTINDLKGFGWSKDQEVEGKIVVKERLDAFNTEEPERDYKIAGDTGIVCCQNGQPIYRKAFYTLNMNAYDETIEHTNGEDIKAAYAELADKKKNVLQPSEDFNKL
jgi:hypothetical protein